MIKIKNIKKYSFLYACNENDFVEHVYYSDDYFKYNSNNYSNGLLTQSLLFVMSAFSSNIGGYDNQYKNCLDLLNKTGFKLIQTNYDFQNRPTSDSLGIIFAFKKIKRYKLICVIARSANYENEWISNFTIGGKDQENYHQGFFNASEIVLDSLKNYLHSNNIKGKIKLWMMGFSRGAAAINIAGGRLIKYFSKNKSYLGNKIKLKHKDLFIYCFETPQGVLNYPEFEIDNQKNDCIYNIINFNDIVTKVVPSKFNYLRYGKELVLPEYINDLDYDKKHQVIIEEYNKIPSTRLLSDYSIDLFNMRPSKLNKIFAKSYKYYYYTLGLYENDLINLISEKVVVSLDNYSFLFQDNIRSSMQEYYEKEDGNKNIFTFFKNSIKEKKIAKIFSSFKKILTSEKQLLLPLISENNINGIKNGHYPELCLAYLRAMDKNYCSNYIKSNLDGRFFKLSFNNDNSEIKILNNDNLIFKYNGEKDIKINNKIPCSIDANSINIFLPYNEIYNIYFNSNCDIKLFNPKYSNYVDIKTNPIISNMAKLIILNNKI